MVENSQEKNIQRPNNTNAHVIIYYFDFPSLECTHIVEKVSIDVGLCRCYNDVYCV